MGVRTEAAAVTLGQEPVARRERRPISLRAFVDRANGESVEVLLLDLAFDGCGIATAAALAIGEAVTLSVLGRGVIPARVCWCSEGKAGLAFVPQEPQSDEPIPREHERAPFRSEALLRRLGGLNYKVHIHDISPDGCKVELIETPRIGEHVLIKFDGLEAFDAEVCWVEGMMAGLNFVRPMHQAVYDMLMQRLR